MVRRPSGRWRFINTDVVFLDIDMPEMNGVEAARELAEMRPGLSFVFATAYPDYTLEAFELYSFDYILKPFDEKRIRKTIRCLRNKVSEDQSLRSQQFLGFLIEVDKREIFISPEEILYIESRKHKVFIKTEKGEYLATSALNRIEQKLNLQVFFRCHKGFLVNLKTYILGYHKRGRLMSDYLLKKYRDLNEYWAFNARRRRGRWILRELARMNATDQTFVDKRIYSIPAPDKIQTQIFKILKVPSPPKVIVQNS